MLTGFKAFDLLSDDGIAALSSYQEAEGVRCQTAGVADNFENFFERTQDDFARNKENRGAPPLAERRFPDFE